MVKLSKAPALPPVLTHRRFVKPQAKLHRSGDGRFLPPHPGPTAVELGGLGMQKALFPLTPALSLGEREKRSPRWTFANVLQGRPRSGWPVRRSHRQPSDLDVTTNRAFVLPLPKGEGWG